MGLNGKSMQIQVNFWYKHSYTPIYIQTIDFCTESMRSSRMCSIKALGDRLVIMAITRELGEDPINSPFPGQPVLRI